MRAADVFILDLLPERTAWTGCSHGHWGPLICELGHTSCSLLHMTWPARGQEDGKAEAKMSLPSWEGGVERPGGRAELGQAGGVLSEQGQEQLRGQEACRVGAELTGPTLGNPGNLAFPPFLSASLFQTHLHILGGDLDDQ